MYLYWMTRTLSEMVMLGTEAPFFDLPDTVSGKNRTRDDLRGKKATLIMFICNHCPFVKHVNPQLVDLAKEYSRKQVSFVAISANDAVNYPEDAPEKMAIAARDLHYPFPYLYDETQDTARAYRATCTPDFFVYDGSLKLVYRGQLDDSRPGNGIPLTGVDIRKALDSILADRPVSQEQRPSIGCNIKWKEPHRS
jgi:thiol-disulfide isomerase/thioredoxin